jgi:hypothetical protein
MGRRQGGAHFLFEVTDRPQSDRHTQDRLGEFLDAPFAGMQDTAHERQRRRQTRTATMSADFLRNLCPGDPPVAG